MKIQSGNLLKTTSKEKKKKKKKSMSSREIPLQKGNNQK